MGENCIIENIETVIDTSVIPKGQKTKKIESDKTGLRITMSWKGWGTLVVFLLTGGGGAVGLNFVTDSQLEKRFNASEKKQTERVESVKIEVEKNRESIETLTITVNGVRDVQHADVAHREARRVVEEQLICNSTQKLCREKRTEKIERLRRINIKRLKNGRETCDQLNCLD